MRSKSAKKSEVGSPLKPQLKFVPPQLLEQLDFEGENPQTNLEKLVSIPVDSPIKEYRSLVHSMLENLNFQKNMLSKIIDPNGSSNNHKNHYQQNKQLFNQYREIITHSHLVKQKKNFEKRKLFRNNNTAFKSSSIKKLAQILQEKKQQLLIDQCPLETQKKKVLCILRDSTLRENLFFESLLIERYQEIQQQKKQGQRSSTTFSTFKSKGNKFRGKRMKTEPSTQLPEKLKGVNPKHIRIKSFHKTEADFEREKYVYNQRKLRFYNYAYKIEKTSKKAQIQNNSDVIKTILEFNDSIGLKGASQTTQQINRLYKLFLKYSNTQDQIAENLYTYITKEGFEKFVRDFSIELRPEIQEHLQSLQKISEFEFMELLYMIGNKQNVEYFNLNQFLGQEIFCHKKLIEPYPFNRISKLKCQYAKLFKVMKFQEIITHIFQNMAQKGGSNKMMDFNQLLQTLWKLQLFPLKIAKKNLRFLYLYGASSSEGLTQTDFQNVVIAIALISITEHQKDEKKIRWILQHLGNLTEKI